jgi:predicted nucleotidyltransferase
MSVDESQSLMLAWVSTVARRLGDLRREVVFLGGATVELLVTDPGAGAPRATKDVDVIVEVGSYAAYAQLQERLRERGFQEDRTPGAPLCRFTVEGVTVDVMPIREDVLGFSNRWYAAAMREAENVSVGTHTIRLISAPCFIATKLEAYRSRGGGDPLLSHDLEDVIAVVDGRAELLSEIRQASSELRQYLADAIARLLGTPAFREALPGYLPGDAASQARLPLLAARLREIGDGLDHFTDSAP